MLCCCKSEKQVHIKKRLFIEKEHEYWVEVLLPSHIMTAVDDKMYDILEYREEELIGKDFRPITISPIMHKYLKEVYNTKLTFAKISVIVKNITKLRYFPFISKSGKVVWISHFHPVILPNPDVKNPFKAKVYFTIDPDCSIAPNIPKEFLEFMTNSPIFCVKHYKNCVIIMMDVANSSSLSTTKTPKEVALMFHEVIKQASTFVNSQFYPFIRFIEACGDSLLFLHCPDLSLTLSDIHSECMYFALKLTEQLNIILEPYNTYIRCGMVHGECAGGVWDGQTFRLSGQNVNLSARLEGKCKKNHVVICEQMYGALQKENYLFSNEVKEEYEDLKGLGVHKLYQINLIKDVGCKQLIEKRLSLTER